MQPFIIQQQSRQIYSPQLPLAVYREVAAHLRQVEGVSAELILRPIEHQPNAKFDYYESQVAALKISYLKEITTKDKQRVAEILDYYGVRYRPWENGSAIDNN